MLFLHIMNVRLTSIQTKPRLVLLGALIFLLQSVAPAFQGAMAGTVEGYTETFCTMYGQETVFVAFGDSQEKTDPSCYKCPACIFQVNAGNGIESYVALIDARFKLDHRAQIERLYLTPSPSFYSHFLSRAPPL